MGKHRLRAFGATREEEEKREEEKGCAPARGAKEKKKKDSDGEKAEGGTCTRRSTVEP